MKTAIIIIFAFTVCMAQIGQTVQKVKFYDAVTGNIKALSFAAEGVRTCSQPYQMAIAEGDIAGHSIFFKFGNVAAINTAELDIVSASVTNPYQWPDTTGSRWVIYSASRFDSTNAVGIRTVNLNYLDTGFNDLNEIISLKGTDTVLTTATKIIRVNRMFALSAGDSGKAQGAILIRKSGAATPIYGAIEIRNTLSMNLCYTVPKSRTLFITSIRASCGTGGANPKPNYVTFMARSTSRPDSAVRVAKVFYPYSIGGLLDGSIIIPLDAPIKFGQKCDLKISAIGDYAAATNADCAIRGWIE